MKHEVVDKDFDARNRTSSFGEFYVSKKTAQHL